ncbi:MAG: NADPH-dependent 7-cyano-7-deazaguanine reductase QueF [Ectothiorhodospiraceae bacterium]|nr:NADPH-dependent 7-cyano-7-deazaguanine reductase QueF [Ectothiorhodospiraceae bacterium]
MSDWKERSPLGRKARYDAAYDPGLLVPIPRAEGRRANGVPEPLPFTGCDIWNAWELSWLDSRGKPEVAWGEFRVPADSPNIIESKSLKLYLNGFNQQRHGDMHAVAECIRVDLSRVVGAEVVVGLHGPEAWPDRLDGPEGHCLDALPVTIAHYQPAPELLQADARDVVEETFHSRLLRSRCPVTGQPDWGGVQIHYRGPRIHREGLLAYVISFRQHQDFHEQCVERMFLDILQHCRPEQLTVEARYLRRGGLDINPFRTNAGTTARNRRWFLQ